MHPFIQSDSEPPPEGCSGLSSIPHLRFLKTPASAAHTTARVHSQVKSGPVSRSNGAAQCAIVRSIRTRTTSHDSHDSHDLDGRSKKPKHARAKSAKRSKKYIENSRKTKEKPFGPWPSLPSAVLTRRDVVNSNSKQNNKSFGPTSPGVARTFFFSFSFSFSLSFT
jgi:hypothetical protein